MEELLGAAPAGPRDMAIFRWGPVTWMEEPPPSPVRSQGLSLCDPETSLLPENSPRPGTQSLWEQFPHWRAFCNPLWRKKKENQTDNKNNTLLPVASLQCEA